MDILTEKLSELRCHHCGSRVNVASQPFLSQIKCPQCNTVLTVPAKLGPFLLLSLLGRGGMGAVYMARDESLNRLVAIKVMLKALGQDREFVETFRREGQAAAALNHPNVVQIYSFGEEQGQPYMVMEMLSGGRLDKMIADGKPLDEGLVLRIGIEVAEGLKAANDVGLVHGDIKPENILMDNNGVAKVVDFGLASFRDKTAQREGIWGTPYYIAPEKVRGQRGDARADIYSLGATLFHALAGRPPFEGATPVEVVKARLETPAADLKTLRPDINPEIAAIVARMLDREPARRYPTYVSLLADMRRILDTDAGEGRMPPQQKKRGKIVLTKTRTIKFGAAGAENTAVPTAGAAKKARKNKVFTPFRIVIGLVIVLIIIGASIGGCVQHGKHVAQKKAAEAERIALSNAVRSAAVALGSIETSITNQLAADERIRTFYDATTNALDSAAATADASASARSALDTLPGPDFLQDVASNAVRAAASLASELDWVREEARAKATAVSRAKTSKDALAIVEKLTLLSTNLDPIARIAQEARDEAAQAAHEAARINEKLVQIKEGEDSAAAATAAAQAEAQRKAAEAAAAKAAAAAQETLKQTERDHVQAAHDNNLEKIRANEYGEALAAIEAAAGELKTPEGKADFQILKSRLMLLVDLKAFLVKQLAAGYRWGWLTPAGDVTGADDKNVMITGKSVPWSQVGPVQMMKFIRHYLDDEALLQRKERARLYLATAVYCYENGAMRPAEQFAGRAGDLNPELKAEAERIMPAPPAPPAPEEKKPEAVRTAPPAEKKP